MEQARVVIVGAGPAGLVLALSLEQNGVKSIILEREKEITQDPRGVYLAGDAVRILWSLGLGKDMPVIGHELHAVNFHVSSFVNRPFHVLDLAKDSLQQAVPTGILQVQPVLEKVLRDRVQTGRLCEIRVGCEVQRIEHDNAGVRIEYTGPDGSVKQLQSVWLVGADGKRGAVRKTFLEKVADIRQVDSDYRYEGTWVAANLKISLPTSETHPDFPAWQAGLSPQEVYDLFWPSGWHFCSPPGKPTASGRFGPHEQCLWRHEFRQDDWNEETMDAEELLWEHLEPMITRAADAKGKPFHKAATYPRDCIKILRCRPFTFTHKLVNRWFHRKSVLIGDAAHVFPPFGGQGIASGIRDAHQLAWRIALLEKQPNASDAQAERVLDAWAKERTQSVKDAAQVTKINGLLCNQESLLLFRLVQIVEWAMQYLFWSKEAYDPQSSAERDGLQRVAGGFFLPDHGGGRRLPQIYMDSINERDMLSDKMFSGVKTPFRLLAIVRAGENPTFSRDTFKDMLLECSIPETVMSSESVAVMSVTPCPPESIGSFAAPTTRKFTPTPAKRLDSKRARPGYEVGAFESRLGRDASYAIVRPDFFVFATARDLVELRVCLNRLNSMLRSE